MGHASWISIRPISRLLSQNIEDALTDLGPLSEFERALKELGVERV